MSIKNNDSGVVIKMSGGVAHKATALRCGCVTGADPDGWGVNCTAGSIGREADAVQRSSEVLFDVHRERTQRRQVHDPGSCEGIVGLRAAGESIESPQKGGQGFACARWRKDQGVASSRYGGPALRLRWRGRCEG